MLAGMTLHVLFADHALLVIDKPAGLLAVPGRGDDKLDCVATRALARWPDAMVVHRLDMATSGLMLMARGAHAQRRLSAAFAEREVHKRYVALVHGIMAGDSGSIALPLAADWPNRPRQKVDADAGKASLTHWWVLSRDPVAQRTRLSLQPLTGRTHQLRVHLQAIGHAIVGDALYAPAPLGPADNRLLLHASQLALTHPDTGAALAFASTPPF